MNEDNGKGYGCFVMAVSGIALLIALIALRRWDIPLYGITATDIDVTNTLSTLVTILIGWQIWQGIDANNRLKRMESSVKESEKRDVQLRHLLEAFQLDRLAQTAGTPGARYTQSVAALRSFVFSGVSSAYLPIMEILARLDGILNTVGSTDDRARRAQFATINRDCDVHFQTILASINEQIGIYQDILGEIRRINRRRRDINEHFVGLDSLEEARNAVRQSANSTTGAH